MNKSITIQKKIHEKGETFNKELLNINLQKDILGKIFMLDNIPEKKSNEELMLKELKSKIQNYKQQDKKHNFYDPDFFISLEKICELLISSKLKCYYCKQTIYILYNNSKQESQWTLDRIENDQGHNEDNCVISCLKCNLNRKTIDSKKFLFTKQMKIIKKI